MRTKLLLPFIALFLLGLASCKTSTTAYSKCETTCISVELDGSYTLRVEGRGTNMSDACLDAEKRAVYDILFTSIPRRDGLAKTLEPICIYKQKAYTDNEAYFNAFFQKYGEYKNYISTKEQKPTSKEYTRTNSQVVCVTTVTVNREKIREKLIEDGIIGQ